MDMVFTGHLSLGTLGLRVVWALNLLAQHWVFPRLSPAGERRYVVFICVTDNLFFTTAIALLGGPSSPFFNFLFAFPLIHALIYPLHPQGLIASGLTAALGYVALGVGAGLPPVMIVTWVLLAGAYTYFSLRSTRQAREVLEAHAQARLERERRELLEQLTLTSYQRAQSEKLALLGRLAANVLHELNNPLAYVRSSVGFLQEEVLGRPQGPGSRWQDLQGPRGGSLPPPRRGNSGAMPLGRAQGRRA
jgi:signal transduction histidine kinase